MFQIIQPDVGPGLIPFLISLMILFALLYFIARRGFAKNRLKLKLVACSMLFTGLLIISAILIAIIINTGVPTSLISLPIVLLSIELIIMIVDILTQINEMPSAQM